MAGLLSRVTTTAKALPSRVFIYAREKWGKSSLFAHAPGAIFFMTRGETGLTELIAGGRVPPTAHFDYDEQHPPTWATLRAAVSELASEDHAHKALVIDTCNGAEILCQEYVRREQFGNSQTKFGAYGKGWEACRVEWLAFLQDLDALRSRRKMSIVLLAHTRVKKFDDPTQDEGYDKYQPACQDKLWELTHKWADIIAFGHFRSETYETAEGKRKATGDMRRVLCFDTSPMWEAGNRYGIAGELNVGGGAANGFKAFANAVAKAKAAGNAPTPAAAPAPVPEERPDDAPAAPEGEQRADPTPAAAAPLAEAPTPGPTAAASTPATNDPAPARPGGQHESPPLTPEVGRDFWEWTQEKDAAFADRGLCAPGALIARLQEGGKRKGLPLDFSKWGPAAVQLAVATTADFEQLLDRPELHAVRAELQRTATKVGACCVFLAQKFKSKWATELPWHEVPTGQLAALRDHLKALPDARKAVTA